MEDIKDKRFREMEQTALELSGEVDNFAKILKSIEGLKEQGLDEYVLNFLREKMKDSPLRAYFCRKIFDYISFYEDFDRESKSITLFKYKLPFLFELIIVIQYLDNHVLDEKHGASLQNREIIYRKMLSSRILRGLILKYLEKEVFPLFTEKEQMFKTIQSFNNLLLYVDTGQHIDKKFNNYASWCDKSKGLELNDVAESFDKDAYACFEPIIELKKEHREKELSAFRKIREFSAWEKRFMKGYFQRIYLTNVYFFRCITDLVINLMDYQGEQKQNMVSFSIRYGFMLQVINDYTDFARSDEEIQQEHQGTTSKERTDFFADLYNFNITLPLIFHLRNTSKGTIVDYLEKGEYDREVIEKNMNEILKEIAESKAVSKCIWVSHYFSKQAKLFLDNENDTTVYLKEMCNIARVNKFKKIFSNKR